MIFKKVALVALMFVGLNSAVLAQEAEQGPFVRGDIVFGSADAPIEVIEYGSMTCPHCGHFSREIFPEIKKQFVDTGKVRFVFRNFIRDRFDLAVATISRCTSDVDVTKALTESFFEHQKEWMQAQNPYEAIGEIAKKGGITQPEMSRCLSDQDAQKHLVEMMRHGVETYQPKGVPAIIVNGKYIDGYSFDVVKAAIEAVQ